MNKKLERLLNENQYGNPSYATLKKQGNELADILEYTEFKKWCGRIRSSGQYLKISTDENGKNKISKQLSMIRPEPLTGNFLQKKTWAQFNRNAPLLGAFKQTTPKSHRIYFNAIAGVALNRFRTSQF